MPRATLNESMNENITNQRNRIISFGTIHNCVTPQVRINLLPNYHFSIHTNHLQASTTSTKTSIVIDWELTIGADYRCWFPNRHLLIGAYTSILLVPVNNGTYTSAGCHLAHTLHWRRGRSPRRGGGASEIRRLRRPPPHAVLEEEKGRGEVPLERGGQLVKITDKTKYIQSSAARVTVGCRYTRPTWRSPPHQPTYLRGFPAGRRHNSWLQAMAEPSPAA